MPIKRRDPKLRTPKGVYTHNHLNQTLCLRLHGPNLGELRCWRGTQICGDLPPDDTRSFGFYLNHKVAKALIEKLERYLEWCQNIHEASLDYEMVPCPMCKGEGLVKDTKNEAWKIVEAAHHCIPCESLGVIVKADVPSLITKQNLKFMERIYGKENTDRFVAVLSKIRGLPKDRPNKLRFHGDTICITNEAGEEVTYERVRKAPREADPSDDQRPHEVGRQEGDALVQS